MDWTDRRFLTLIAIGRKLKDGATPTALLRGNAALSFDALPTRWRRPSVRPDQSELAANFMEERLRVFARF